MQRAEVEQGRAGRRVDENVEVASPLVAARKRRTKHARIGRAKPSGRFANRVSMKSEGDRPLHAKFLNDDVSRMARKLAKIKQPATREPDSLPVHSPGWRSRGSSPSAPRPVHPRSDGSGRSRLPGHDTSRVARDLTEGAAGRMDATVDRVSDAAGAAVERIAGRSGAARDCDSGAVRALGERLADTVEALARGCAVGPRDEGDETDRSDHA